MSVGNECAHSGAAAGWCKHIFMIKPLTMFREGFDCNEVFAPSSRHDTLRALIARARARLSLPLASQRALLPSTVPSAQTDCLLCFGNSVESG
jgi:hypothetical protein